MQVGEILLLEHYPPVYTFGLRQKDYAIHAEGLRNLGAEVHKVHPVFRTPIADCELCFRSEEEDWPHSMVQDSWFVTLSSTSEH